MKLALLALGTMLIVAVGVYIGLSGFQQYALESSRSFASQTICSPEKTIVAPGRAVLFSAIGLPDTTMLYWSSPEGQSEQTSDNRLSVIYSQRGTKTVSVFFRIGNLWERTSCTVAVR